MGISVIVLILALSCFGCKQAEVTPPDLSSVDVVSPVKETPGFSGPQSEPVRIKIEKINIDEKVDPVGMVNGAMATPPGALGVSWYKDAGGKYPSPGWSGNALLTAHNYFNLVPGTFVDLYKLVVGDSVEFTYADGSKGIFVVKSTKIYGENDKDGFANDRIMTNDEETRTTLITCHGDRKDGGGYPQRFVAVLGAVKHVDANGEEIPSLSGAQSQ